MLRSGGFGGGGKDFVGDQLLGFTECIATGIPSLADVPHARSVIQNNNVKCGPGFLP